MKKLQNNFTTPEQSKRLLELGLPADSADCFYLRDDKKKQIYLLHEKLSMARMRIGMGHAMPSWSVGRLIEIITICIEWFKGQEYHNITFTKGLASIDVVIHKIEIAHQERSIDFSKLEE